MAGVVSIRECRAATTASRDGLRRCDWISLTMWIAKAFFGTMREGLRAVDVLLVPLCFVSRLKLVPARCDAESFGGRRYCKDSCLGMLISAQVWNTQYTLRPED